MCCLSRNKFNVYDMELITDSIVFYMWLVKGSFQCIWDLPDGCTCNLTVNILTLRLELNT